MPIINRCGAAVSTPVSTGEYRVRFIDYNGTILKESFVNSGGSVSPPSNTSHDGLIFQGWNYTTLEYTNITRDLDIGAIYTTVDRKTRLNIKLTTVTGLSPTLYLVKSDTSTLSIDWGDGSVVTTDSTSGNATYSHTYTANGDYSIALWISNGNGVITLGQGTGTTVVIGGSVQNYISAIVSANIGTDVTIGSYAFTNCFSLTSITIPNSVTSIGAYAFYFCYALTSVTIPNSVTSIGTYSFNGCSSARLITIPNNVTSIGTYAFSACYSLTSITIPNGVTSIGSGAFQTCFSLTSITIPNSVTSIGASTFSSCRSLTSITIPNSVTSIGATAFSGCYSLKKYIFTPASVPVLSSINAFTNILPNTKIYVPDTSLSSYKTATNWSTYTNYIYALSAIGE
jgi:hypothetical protein